MLTRAMLAAALLLALLMALRGLRWWQLRRVNRAGPTPVTGRTVVYFWSPQCSQCEHAQKAVLQRLDGVRVISHNVLDNPGLADAWGVSTVPTTFVMGADGRARHVNNGLASEAVLRRQLKLPASAATGQAQP